jgi:hypothetical protein
MFFQFATEETLVPPNLSTTQGELAVGAAAVAGAEVLWAPGATPGTKSLVMYKPHSEGRVRAAPCAAIRIGARAVGAGTASSTEQERGPGGPRETLLFFLEIFQFFLQAAVGKHVFQLAPGGLALLRGGRGAGTRPSSTRINELFVTLSLVGLCDEVIVEIEVIVVSLHHGIPENFPEKSNTSDPGTAGSLRTIYDAPGFSMAAPEMDPAWSATVGP